MASLITIGSPVLKGNNALGSTVSASFAAIFIRAPPNIGLILDI